MRPDAFASGDLVRLQYGVLYGSEDVHAPISTWSVNSGSVNNMKIVPAGTIGLVVGLDGTGKEFEVLLPDVGIRLVNVNDMCKAPKPVV